MPIYYDRDGDSGIDSYECGDDWIEVTFAKGKHRVYRYTYSSAGSLHVNTMKGLAVAGDGLNSYINLHVARGYDSKR